MTSDTNVSEETSKAALDQTESASVYEFLYHDARRVGSFLAQLNPQGHLQAKKTTSGLKGAKSTGGTTTLTGGVVPVASASQGANKTFIDEHSSSLDASYDPLWSNAVALLDYLDQRNLIQRLMVGVSIGQVVLISGRLSITDLSILNGVWQSNDIKSKMVGDKKSPDFKNNNIGYEIVKTLPHLVQATITCEHPFSASWMFLDKPSMVLTPETLLLNYGTCIPGSWNVLGIKDADPDDGYLGLKPEVIAEANDDLMAASAKYYIPPLVLLSQVLIPHARQIMGRPGPYFGITPILIFREITASVKI